MEAILFWVFAAMAVVCALMVVSMRNPMYGAISLLGTFLAVAVLFFLRHAEFLGVVQVFVYGGGIMVLFLFVIMLVNLHRLKESTMFAGHWPMAAVLAVLLIAMLGFVFSNVQFGPGLADASAMVAVEGEEAGNSEAVAWLLYREYLLPFEIVSVFLLVAMIGAVVLGRHARMTDRGGS